MTEDMKKDSLPVEEETVETVETVETAAENRPSSFGMSWKSIRIGYAGYAHSRRISPFYQTPPPGRTCRR